MQKIILRKVRFSPYEVRLNRTSENFENSKKIWKLRKVDFWGFSEFSNAQFNSHELNLTSGKPMQSQINARWDLMSHKSEILHSMIFSVFIVNV